MHTVHPSHQEEDNCALMAQDWQAQARAVAGSGHHDKGPLFRATPPWDTVDVCGPINPNSSEMALKMLVPNLKRQDEPAEGVSGIIDMWRRQMRELWEEVGQKKGELMLGKAGMETKEFLMTLSGTSILPPLHTFIHSITFFGDLEFKKIKLGEIRINREIMVLSDEGINLSESLIHQPNFLRKRSQHMLRRNGIGCSFDSVRQHGI
ncbi:hypothetical protein BKA82DRAFT_4017381 [Pisolithus tinctorius]|nr:hypothetical protein BKA82DRAFT_4017381 [Pisolithus tinctorius]